MKIETTTKYGGSAKENRDGFKLALEATLSEAQMEIAAAIGLASIAYRGGASVINKALKVESNAGAEYSDEAARTVETALTEWAKGKDSPIEGGFDLSVVATRHEHGQAGDSVYKAETEVYDRNEKAGTLPTLAGKVGYSGDAERGEDEKPPKAFLTAIRVFVRAEEKKRLQGL